MPDQDNSSGATDSAVPTPRPPVPDLGFFAGSTAAAGGTGAVGPPATRAFAAPSTGFGPPPSDRFGAPAATQFGAPAGPPAPPDWDETASATGHGRGGTGWTIGAAVAAVVVLAVVVLAGRFGWQQFVADPVVPKTLAGMPRVVGPEIDAMASAVDSEIGSELSAGSETKLALYTDGTGLGYLLVAVRGGSASDDAEGSADDGSDPSAGWTKSTVDGLSCSSQEARSEAGMAVTFCVRGLWRRAVVVYAMGAVPPDPATVARATNDAWDAQ